MGVCKQGSGARRYAEESDEEEEVKVADLSDDDEENIGQVISLQPDIQSSSVASETSSPSEGENKLVGSAGDPKGGEIPATQEEVEQKSQTSSAAAGAISSEDKQATNGVASASSDEIVQVVVEGSIEEAQADSALEIIIVHDDEDDGIRSPTQSPTRSPILSPDPHPKRQRDKIRTPSEVK